MTAREPWLAAFNRHAWIAIAFAVGGAVAALAVSSVATPTYTAHSTLWVEGIEQRDYAGEMRGRIQAPARGRLTISQPAGSRFVNMRYEDTSAVAAAQVLNGIARRYIASSPNWPNRLVVLDSAIPPKTSTGGGRLAIMLRWSLVALAAGLAASVILTVRERQRA